MKAFTNLEVRQPQEREKTMHEHRRKSGQKLAMFLDDVLQPKQREPLFQLQLQQAGAFALLGENEALPLKITDDQRKQFMGVVQDLHRKIESLIKTSRSETIPTMRKVTMVRRDQAKASRRF